VDACVPFVGTEEWTSALGFPVIEAWRPWLAGTPQNASAQVGAGYVTTYEAGPNHNFTFLTIKGAGHMVPQFKPVSALAFIQRFYRNEPF
jgi:serine carboxypeptidase-like clade 1